MLSAKPRKPSAVPTDRAKLGGNALGQPCEDGASAQLTECNALTAIQATDCASGPGQ